MKSHAQTPEDYLASLPLERLEVMERLRRVLKDNLPEGFEETMAYGMLAYVVPHHLYPDGYHCDPQTPLPFINLASQKQYISLYHMGLYEDSLLTWLKNQWAEHTSAKWDVGRCCLRLRKLDDVPYELIAQLARRITPQEWIAQYTRARQTPRRQRGSPSQDQGGGSVGR